MRAANCRHSASNASADRASATETRLEQDRVRRTLATQRAQGASSGLAGGSLLDVLASSQTAAEADLLTLRRDQTARRNQIQTRRNTDIASLQYGAANSAWAGLTSARIGAANARTTGLFGALGTIGGSAAMTSLLESD